MPFVNIQVRKSGRGSGKTTKIAKIVNNAYQNDVSHGLTVYTCSPKWIEHLKRVYRRLLAEQFPSDIIVVSLFGVKDINLPYIFPNPRCRNYLFDDVFYLDDEIQNAMIRNLELLSQEYHITIDVYAYGTKEIKTFDDYLVQE